jgi:uncharacterized membrane protein YgaE (UPF0421/DUF939 family)
MVNPRRSRWWDRGTAIALAVGVVLIWIVEHSIIALVLAPIVAVPIYFKLRLWSTWSDEDD